MTTEERPQGGEVTAVARVAGPEVSRRRVASRPAGPPPEPDDQLPSVTTVAAGTALLGPVSPASERPVTTPEVSPDTEEVVATPVEPVEESRQTSKRTTTRRRTAPAEPEAAAEPKVTSPDESEAAPAAEETDHATAAPRRRTVRRKRQLVPERSRAMSAVEAEVAAAVERALHAEEATPGDVPDTEPAQEPAEDVAEPVADQAVPEPAAGQPERPPVVTDPFGWSAPQPVIPTVTFQAPAVLFQPVFQAPDPFVALPPAVPADESDELDDTDDADETLTGSDSESVSPRRRRRRGGRGRGGRAKETEDVQEPETSPALVEAAESSEVAEQEPAEPAESVADDHEQPVEEPQSTSRRRRRRRRRNSEEETEPTPDEPPNTVVRIRVPRASRATVLDEVQGVRGSTRLEAKKQRRREGRELGRRRPPIITESEFLARRESVERVMIVRRRGGRTQIAVLEDGVLVEHYVDRASHQSYVGNVYLGKVQNVLPSMEAAFVDIGKGRNAVLYAGEVNFDSIGMEGQPKRIEAALKSGQSVLVQVTKDPIGHKGARLTSQISLPGRYLVYVPDGSMTGISRKLPDKERARLKQILRKVMPENAGVIVRTAAEGASEEELSRDVARLSAQWENIQRKAKSASAPALLSGEPDLTIRVVRDIFNEDFNSLVVEGDDVWETIEEYVRYVAPHLADRLSKWEETIDVFTVYRVDEQIAKAMERKVWLPSGGSLVIDRTEAMTVVDVNTGKFTGQGGNLEETVTRNNLEAAEEIVRQLRLRDIGGIIVIDFIDMVLESNRDLVLRRLLECLARDRTKHQVAEVTSLGLVQMTRKRVGQGLLEAFSTPCECCHGRGIIVSTEPVEGKPEPRGTQAKMAIEKAVAEKTAGTNEPTAVAAAVNGRAGITDVITADEDDPPATSTRGRRRSRKKAAE